MNGRRQYPHTMFLVAGTQAEERKENKIVVFKAYDLNKTKYDKDEDDDDDEIDGAPAFLGMAEGETCADAIAN